MKSQLMKRSFYVEVVFRARAIILSSGLYFLVKESDAYAEAIPISSILKRHA